MEKKENFTVSSTYRLVIDGGLRFSHGNLIWMKKCLLKMRIFMWLVVKNAILTWNNLQKRGWKGPNRCALCKSTYEDGNHLLLTCPCSIIFLGKSAALSKIRIDISVGSSAYSGLQAKTLNRTSVL